MSLLLLGCPTTTDVWFGGDFYYGDHDPVALLGAVPGRFPGVPAIVNLEGALAGPELPVLERSPVRLRNRRARLPALPFLAFGVANNHAADAPGELPPSGVSWPRGEPTLGLAQAWLTPGAVSHPDTFADRSWSDSETRIAMFHVSRGGYLPTPEDRAAAEIALAAGADLVLFHGSHVVGPVERRREAAVVWGLGNLAMACDCTTETEGLAVRASFQAGRLVRLEAVPIRAGLDGAPAALAPDPAGVLDLLEALGSSPWTRGPDGAVLTW